MYCLLETGFCTDGIAISSFISSMMSSFLFQRPTIHVAFSYFAPYFEFSYSYGCWQYYLICMNKKTQTT